MPATTSAPEGGNSYLAANSLTADIAGVARFRLHVAAAYETRQEHRRSSTLHPFERQELTLWWPPQATILMIFTQAKTKRHFYTDKTTFNVLLAFLVFACAFLKAVPAAPTNLSAFLESTADITSREKNAADSWYQMFCFNLNLDERLYLIGLSTDKAGNMRLAGMKGNISD
jgi:hypothetical protein